MKALHILALFGISSSYALNVCQTIITSSGPVCGYAATAEPGVTAFLGIPYALPPVGKRRFMPPEKYHGDKLINGNSVVSVSRILTYLSFHSVSTTGIRLPSNHTLRSG